MFYRETPRLHGADCTVIVYRLRKLVHVWLIRVYDNDLCALLSCMMNVMINSRQSYNMVLIKS
jgi:hypothetical protein